MREGRTTGTCAAAATAAAARYLQDGTVSEAVAIDTPAGKRLVIETRFVEADGNAASFAVLKDAGDDPDVTDGMDVLSRVELRDGEGDIEFAAGEGVGIVTKPGLKIPPGQPAINPVPREMIAREIRDRFPRRAATVTVSIPGGDSVAKRTFNPRLGIEGGLSVLGTTGIVRPMSAQALIDTIYEELNVKAAISLELLILTFGAMGERALEALGYDADRMAQVSNYVGLALDRAAKLGFHRIVLGGHVGKLCKVSAGIFMTHSATADARAEIVVCHAALCGVPLPTLRTLYDAPTTKAADAILLETGLAADVWRSIGRETEKRATLRAGRRIECVLLDDAGQPLFASTLDEGGLVCEN